MSITVDGLFKFGLCSFAHLIKADSFNITPNARQDMDSYRDADGVLQRNALSHTATIIEFDTIPMWDDNFHALMSSMSSQYINENERDANCTYYDVENGLSKTGHFYLDSNFKATIKQVWNGKVLYDSAHFKFVEY